MSRRSAHGRFSQCWKRCCRRSTTIYLIVFAGSGGASDDFGNEVWLVCFRRYSFACFCEQCFEVGHLQGFPRLRVRLLTRNRAYEPYAQFRLHFGCFRDGGRCSSRLPSRASHSWHARVRTTSAYGAARLNMVPLERLPSPCQRTFPRPIESKDWSPDDVYGVLLASKFPDHSAFPATQPLVYNEPELAPTRFWMIIISFHTARRSKGIRFLGPVLLSEKAAPFVPVNI